MSPLRAFVSLVLAPLVVALRALRRWLRVDTARAPALVPVRIQADRPLLRLPPPRERRHD